MRAAATARGGDSGGDSDFQRACLLRQRGRKEIVVVVILRDFTRGRDTRRQRERLSEFHDVHQSGEDLQDAVCVAFGLVPSAFLRRQDSYEFSMNPAAGVHEHLRIKRMPGVHVRHDVTRD